MNDALAPACWVVMAFTAALGCSSNQAGHAGDGGIDGATTEAGGGAKNNGAGGGSSGTAASSGGSGAAGMSANGGTSGAGGNGPGGAGNGGKGGAGGGRAGNSGSGGGNAGAGGKSGSGGSGGTMGTGGRMGTGGNAGPSTSASRQTARPIGNGNKAPNGYYEYLPPGYDGSAAAPLLVFWNGIGSDGNGASDIDLVIGYGPPEIIRNNAWPDSRPFIVLAPQYTAKGGDIAPGSGCPSSTVVDAFLTWATSAYKIDSKRIYLTGLSCGAIGSWDYLADHGATVVAAAVLLSGNPGDPTQATSVWHRAGGCALGSVAIWSLHGDMDDVVPYAPDHDTMQDLLACPSPPRRAATFTTVAGGSHNIWLSTYDLSAGYGDIYQWLLDNAKP